MSWKNPLVLICLVALLLASVAIYSKSHLSMRVRHGESEFQIDASPERPDP